MKLLDRKDLQTIAKEFAMAHSLEHTYIPITEEEMKNWKPHEWVIGAMHEAYCAGLRDATKLHAKD